MLAGFSRSCHWYVKTPLCVDLLRMNGTYIAFPSLHLVCYFPFQEFLSVALYITLYLTLYFHHFPVVILRLFSMFSMIYNYSIYNVIVPSLTCGYVKVMFSLIYLQSIRYKQGWVLYYAGGCLRIGRSLVGEWHTPIIGVLSQTCNGPHYIYQAPYKTSSQHFM